VLGATGSLGQTAVRVAVAGGLSIPALAGGRRQDVLAGLVRAARPRLVACRETPRGDLARAIEAVGAQYAVGQEGLEAVAAHPAADAVLVAVSGLDGLAPARAAIRAGRPLVMGCKEALVGAGALLTHEARRAGVPIRPLDSEHAAAARLIEAAGGVDAVDELIVTGSGGPVRDVDPGDLPLLPMARVLAHPVWRMGPKITVDSATMLNKALEVVEASVLFGLPPERIGVLLDPTARVHAVLRTRDGRPWAFVGPPDMAVPVRRALGIPDPDADAGILEGPAAREALASLVPLSPFQEDVVDLGRRALALGGTAPMALVAADEVAVSAYLAGRIPITRVAALVARTLDVVGEQAAARSSLDLAALELTAHAAELVVSGLLEDDSPA
jgi:1-deoxy-D-xylulose-5-phosphate reductoisomerase